MKLFLLSVSVCFWGLASALLDTASTTKEVCRSLQPPRIEDACKLSEEFDEMAPCLQGGRRITEEEKCKISLCCWRNSSIPQCFEKPKKCYVDLRREKCFKARMSVGYNKIYTGHSINGTYCHVSSIPYTTEELGQIKGVGFPIFTYSGNNFPPCLHTWVYRVRTTGNGKCEVDVIQPRNKTLSGELFFNQACVYLKKFPFHFESFNEFVPHCTCTTDAWLQSDDEDVSISDDVKAFVESRESLSTCTQVLGMITRLSWRDRILLINREEVDEVMNALSNLTHIEKTTRLTNSDAKAFLNSTRKVAQYPFYEKIDEDSATDLMKKTTSVISNLIASFAKPKVEPQASASHSTLDDASETDFDVNADADESPELRHELFYTLDTMSETIASRMVPLKNNTDLTLRAVENHVDLSMVVTQSSNSEKLLEKSHFSDLTDETSDLVSVLGVSPIERMDSEAADDSIALVSVFYDYPPSPDNRRVSKYLSVNVKQFVKGKAKKLSVPVNFTLTHDTIKDWPEFMVPTCSFLGPNTTREDWQYYGCKTTNHLNSNKTTCECNHTTNFAVLMKFTPSQLPGSHNAALQILSLVLGVISIGCLIITLYIFINYRKRLLKDRMIIHFQLVVALFFGYISVLTSSIFASSTTQVLHFACLLCTYFTHYFFLAVFFFSLVEGMYLFYKIVLVFRQAWASSVPRFSPIVGWICPLVIVTISFVLSRTTLESKYGKDTYADPATCFLTKENGMIWAYAGPVLFVISVNIVVLFKISQIIFKSSYTSSRLSSVDESTRIRQSLKQSSRGALVLMPILGIPTIVSLLYNFYTGDPKEADKAINNWNVVVGTVGAYVQVILTGIQGILIFIFYCYFNADVRSAYELATRRRQSIGNLEATDRSRKQSRLTLLGARNSSSAGSKEVNNNQPSRSASRVSSFAVPPPSKYGRSPITDRNTFQTTRPINKNGTLV